MEADFKMKMTLNGTVEEIKKAFKLLGLYQNDDTNRSEYFIQTTVNGIPFNSEETNDSTIEILKANESIVIEADGPFGEYSELNDIEFFKELASEIPNATFEASVEGWRSYSEETYNCKLENGILSIENTYDSSDCQDECWTEYFTDILPYNDFVDLFKINEDNFTDENYEEFIVNLRYEFQNLTGCTLDELTSFFDYEEGDVGLDEEEFSQKWDSIINEREIKPFDTYFEEDYEIPVSRNYKYDPIKKTIV